MSLKEYWQKRDFGITSEPRGEVTKPGKQLVYYIQRHHARRLHYDFRLELEGTLKSWAVPKGPSLDPTDKRLAVHVEDHPLSYGTFEGEIPAGQYGAGQVVLWDKGVWLPIGDPDKGYRSGSLKFELQGEKLAGKWALVRMGKKNQDQEASNKDGQENWLLIKEHDDYAKSHDEYQVTEARPESVLKLKPKKVKKAVDDLATVDESSTKEKPAKSFAKTKPASIAKSASNTIARMIAPKAPLPDQLKPQLATLVKSAPSGDEWLCELKYDGYRALTRIEHNEARIYTRNGHDWTGHWPLMAAALNQLPVDEAWLDGEVVAMRNGKIDFGALQNYAADDANIQLRYFLFDIVYLNGQDLSGLPLLERKELLKTLLQALDPSAPIQYSDHIVGNVSQVFKQACEQALEGIVIKRADSAYAQTRSQSWLKLKCVQRQEFVIGGFTDPEGERIGFGALLLGWYNDDGELMYAGRVGTGFNQQNINALYKRMKSLETKKPAYVNPPKGYDAKGVHWLKPELVGEVKFAEWTSEGNIRHSSFVALREDKKPKEITREVAIKPREINEEVDAAAKTSQASNKKAKTVESEVVSKAPKQSKPLKEANTMMKNQPKNHSDADTVADIKISHPDRVIFSTNKITKFELAEYYQAAERWIMPHIINRPLSLLRCPEGAEKECFFQKHLGELTLKYVEKLDIPGNDNGAYLVVRDIRGLIELVQMGVIEFHTWGSTTDNLQNPDRIIFDLDPDPAVLWSQVIEGAKLVEFLLTNLGLESYLKTTGGKGLHIVVPIKPDHEFAVIKQFSKSIANHLAETIPSHFVAVMSKAKRKNKIFVDYLRNGEEATAIAAFSVRAREGAPISVPILWDELKEDLPSNFYNMRNIFDLFRSKLTDPNMADPWKNYFTHPQAITEQMLHTFD